MEVGRADIGIDLGAQPFADSDRAELVMDVVRDDASPLATRPRISSGARPSSSATSIICGVIIPLRAASIWVMAILQNWMTPTKTSESTEYSLNREAAD